MNAIDLSDASPIKTPAKIHPIFSGKPKESSSQPQSTFEMKPLAERMRPQSEKKNQNFFSDFSAFEEFLGQENIIGDKGVLKSFLSGKLYGLPSMILWAPPGTGKTTLAKLIQKSCECNFFMIAATDSGLLFFC